MQPPPAELFFGPPRRHGGANGLKRIAILQEDAFFPMQVWEPTAGSDAADVATSHLGRPPFQKFVVTRVDPWQGRLSLFEQAQTATRELPETERLLGCRK